MDKALRGNRYPGRGLLLGQTLCGKYAVAAYFIMGRSVNSRNRRFVQEGESLRTEAVDPARMSDPSLVIYYPVRPFGNSLIVTNGDQTDTIFTALGCGGTFEDALRTRTFEPDPPIFTPRISGLMTVGDGRLCYKLSILKSGRGEGRVALRQFFEYEKGTPGIGHLIHTYETDGNPPPSFRGEPKEVALGQPLCAFAEALWDALDGERRISLYVSYTELSTGRREARVINRYDREALL